MMPIKMPMSIPNILPSIPCTKKMFVINFELAPMVLNTAISPLFLLIDSTKLAIILKEATAIMTERIKLTASFSILIA